MVARAATGSRAVPIFDRPCNCSAWSPRCSMRPKVNQLLGFQETSSNLQGVEHISNTTLDTTIVVVSAT
jgi:hypothetical protein